MPDIERQYRNSILVEYRDISDIENYKFLLSLREKYNAQMAIKIPVFFFKGKLLNARENIVEDLRRLLERSLMNPHHKVEVSSIDLIAYFKDFTPLAILTAGLLDGINPCAFTVIIFFISFLTLQGYRKRDMIVIGTGFIFAVFLTYLLIGLGLFNFLYQLKNFWVVTKVFNMSIGLFSIILGLFAVYDFLKYRKTKETDGLLLQLPASVKNRIHYVIGLHYRKSKSPVLQEASGQRSIFQLTATALATGFLVSILEAVCTGQAYLPTISFILKTTALKWEALFYLLAYNFMFIAPLGAIFVLALMGATSQQFSKFLKRHLLTIKILMAILFFGFGIFLIWRA